MPLNLFVYYISKPHIKFLKRAAIDNTAKNIILNNYTQTNSLEEDLQTKDYMEYLQRILNTLTPQSREVFRLLPPRIQKL